MDTPFRTLPLVLVGLGLTFTVMAGLAIREPEAGSVIGTEPPAATPATPAAAAVSSSSFVVFPADCNANPPMLFGGKMLAEMDRIAGITTRRFLYDSPTGARDAVTIAINSVRFYRPAKVKDLVVVSGSVAKIGDKSVTIAVKVEREALENGSVVREPLAEGEFVFVSVTTDGEKTKPIPHGLAKTE